MKHFRPEAAPLVRSFISFPCIRRTGLEAELREAAEYEAGLLLGDEYEGPLNVVCVWVNDYSDDGHIAICGAEILAAREIDSERESA